MYIHIYLYVYIYIYTFTHLYIYIYTCSELPSLVAVTTTLLHSDTPSGSNSQKSVLYQIYHAKKGTTFTFENCKYGVASASRIDTILSLFCTRAL